MAQLSAGERAPQYIGVSCLVAFVLFCALSALGCDQYSSLSLSLSLSVCVCVFAVCVLQRACVCAYVPDEKLLSCEQFAVCVCFCVSVFVRGRCEPGEVRAHVRVKMFRV